MNHFLEAVEYIQEQQQKLTDYNCHLSKLILDINNKKEISILIKIFDKTAKKLKGDIIDLNKNIMADDPFYDTKQTQYRNALRRFYEELNIFKETQLKEREIEQIKLQEDYAIAYPAATSEEIQGYIKAGKESGKSPFSDSSFLDKRIVQRHESIHKLSEDVIKIMDLIEEIKELVLEKRVDVEMIEIDIQETVRNAQRANTNLEGALRKQKIKNKFWKWIARFLGFIILCLLFYLGFKFLSSYFSK
ncbi:Protein SSO2 [Cucumispora dikerogammari]|nr:Protein SSO2 [Cucumispora dikerogammari]